MKVEVLMAWPRRFESVSLELPMGATLADGLAAAGWSDAEGISGYAIFGVNAAPVSYTHLDVYKRQVPDPVAGYWARKPGTG